MRDFAISPSPLALTKNTKNGRVLESELFWERSGEGCVDLISVPRMQRGGRKNLFLLIHPSASAEEERESALGGYSGSTIFLLFSTMK